MVDFLIFDVDSSRYGRLCEWLIFLWVGLEEC